MNCYTTGEVIGSGAAGGIPVLANSYDGQESYIKELLFKCKTVSDQAASGGKAGGIAGQKVGVGGFIELLCIRNNQPVTKGGGRYLGQIDKSCDIAIKWQQRSME